MNYDIDISVLTPEEQDQILLAAAQQLPKGLSFFSSIEELLTSEEGLGLIEATALQRAICRAIQGKPLGKLWDIEEVRLAFGGNKPEGLPAEVVIVAAIRSAKSMIAASTSIWASQKCDLSGLTAGEIPRYSILSLEKDNAHATLSHLLGALAKPRLSPLLISKKEEGQWADLIEESGSSIVGSVFLRHPSGRPVEIRVVAGKRAGGSLISRWSLGCTLEEATRMVGASEGVINYDDARHAVIARFLPGAQLLSVGSPWQPYGPIFDVVQAEWGNTPTPGRIIIKARGPWMHPQRWTPEACEELKRRDPVAYQTDVLAEFADAEESLFTQVALNRCLRPTVEPLAYIPGHDYVAAMDPATRGNAWTLVICDREGNKKRVVLATEWQGSSIEPLSPKAVLKEASELLAKYQLDWCYTDQWAADANKDIALDFGFALVVEEMTTEEKVNAYLSLASNMLEGKVELPRNNVMLKDLKLVKRKPTSRGVAVHLPLTPDGRHCDYAPALVQALRHWLDEERELDPKPGDPGYLDFTVAKMEQREVEEFDKKKKAPWWDGGEISRDTDSLSGIDFGIQDWLG